jgi:hypothetical protein
MKTSIKLKISRLIWTKKVKIIFMPKKMIINHSNYYKNLLKTHLLLYLIALRNIFKT